MSNPNAMFVLDHATVSRSCDAAILRDLSWTVRRGETWAVAGPVGSGKTTLAEVMLGRVRGESGTIAWPFLGRVGATFPSDVIQKVSFKDDSWLFSYSRHYYQQRFNFIEPQDDLSLAGFLRAGSAVSDDRVAAVAERLGIGALLPLSLIKLSNGQARRARFARALLLEPQWLILDDPFLGLDAGGRDDVARMVGELIDGGLHVTLIARRDAIPEWVTNVLELPRLHGEPSRVSGRALSKQESGRSRRSSRPEGA